MYYEVFGRPWIKIKVVTTGGTATAVGDKDIRWDQPINGIYNMVVYNVIEPRGKSCLVLHFSTPLASSRDNRHLETDYQVNN